MGFDQEEIEERVDEQAEKVEERLEHIPDGQTMPDREDMLLASAKKFTLGIVFIDINDFSNYSSDNPERDVLFMLNLFIPEIMEIVRDYDGYFEKNTGDGILAYFGVGKDYPTISETVLEYIATVKYALANHVNPTLEDHDIEPITISGGAGIGKNIHVSRIGKHSLNRRTAVGTTANSASKLEDMAETNQYFVNEGIHRHADKEDGWGQYLTDKGRLEGFRWGSDDSGWETQHYYNFSGIWTGTETDNLR
ncbi:adenylate/guanylate cyclase domain-containing protein [Halorarum salinum]|uniref:Adenylate/guanylate cyclase domain-containing protein n=1 Tax=Halorarum salinum TaxID=2743089 RepID=A0A7D5LBC8_9EURY|nr:adenylate/guanylate cyclase domain-containing protein [Halobaculum salinum]QLG62035.1 adenylate/guanylate cyclase domain-containing protein [Halobaculum salinum]